MWSTLDKSVRNKAREGSSQLARSLEEISAVRKRVPKEVSSAADSDLVVKRASLEADEACEHYQELDAVLVEIMRQAQPLCLDLAKVVSGFRSRNADFVAGLLAFVSRSLRIQESFSMIVGKARSEARNAAEREALSLERDKAKMQIIEERLKDAHVHIRRLQEELSTLRRESEELELEVNRPSWQWDQQAADPVRHFGVPSVILLHDFAGYALCGPLPRCCLLCPLPFFLTT